MNKELIKEIIKMFLYNEREVYEAIREISRNKEAKDKAKEVIASIECMTKHVEDYDSTIEIICENLNKKEKKTSKLK